MDYICSDGDDGLLQLGICLYKNASADNFFLLIALVDDMFIIIDYHIFML